MTALTFNELTNPELRAWNRASMIFNIAKDKSMKESGEYAAQFSQADKDDISKMFNTIKEDGLEHTRARISRLVQTIEREVENV